MEYFVVVGARKELLIRVLLSINAFAPANCVAVCANGTRYIRFTNLCRKCWYVSFSGEDDDVFVEKVNDLADTARNLMIVSSDCEGARMVDRVRSRLHAKILPSPDSGMLDCFDNKWNFYKFCKENTLRVPASCLAESKHEIDFIEIANALGMPFVVKPLNEQGSEGVLVISSWESYEQTLLKNNDYQYAPLILQSYVQGVDVDLDMLAIQGQVVAIAIQQRESPQTPEAKIHFLSNDYLESVAYSVAKNARYHGVMHIDARIEEGTGKVFLFESNPRFWLSLSASTWCGLNFVAESMKPLGQHNDVRMLTSGIADTYYHPVFRSELWRHVILDWHSHQGRMARLMMCDLDTLANQCVTLSKEIIAKFRIDATSAQRLKFQRSRIGKEM